MSYRSNTLVIASDPPQSSQQKRGNTFTERASLVSMIAAHAAVSPQALAISAPDARMVYKDLERSSDKLAHRLRRLGVGPGSRVAIALPRSAAMIISALAVFKAGGAYISLDPSHPAGRLKFALNDSEAAILLTDTRTTSRLPETSCEVLTIEPGLEFAEADNSLLAPNENSPDSAAYIIYTSGSTGRQRGVEICHASLLNLVQWHIRNFRIAASDRATQVASPAFDASVWEIWPYLAAGASLHIPAEETRCSHEALRDYFVNEHISIAFVPTVLAERMITLPWPEKTSLRTMLTGGDTLHHFPPSHLPFALVNNYGPTEATVVTTSTTIIAKDNDARLPAIGIPIDNCRVYILDEQLRPVAAGDDGEICIGGTGVARGYLNHPELMRERFIPDPFADAPGARLYRSGDRGRILPNGELLFLGRMDDQIKLRGYRIEPQEVVSAMNSHRLVLDSAVKLGCGAAGESSLFAYVVPVNSELTRSDLLEFLGKKLPPYMIPSVFVRLDALPATDNGKVDRAKLPLPSLNNMLPERASSALPDGVQAGVAAIVCDLLHIEQIGAEENFFLSGGHSLLGAQVIARLRDAFGVELPLRMIFRHPSVAKLSSEVEKLLAQQPTQNGNEAACVLDEWPAA